MVKQRPKRYSESPSALSQSHFLGLLWWLKHYFSYFCTSIQNGWLFLAKRSYFSSIPEKDKTFPDFDIITVLWPIFHPKATECYTVEIQRGLFLHFLSSTVTWVRSLPRPLDCQKAYDMLQYIVPKLLLFAIVSVCFLWIILYHRARYTILREICHDIGVP